MRDTVSLKNLLASAPSPAAANALLGYVQALPGRIARGDLMIGILSVEEVKHAPSAIEQAASWGAPAAWLELARWHAAPPLGAPDPVAMERALGKARELGVPDAELETVRLRWFYRRDNATPAERAETCRLARQLARTAELHALLCPHSGCSPRLSAEARLGAVRRSRSILADHGRSAKFSGRLERFGLSAGMSVMGSRDRAARPALSLSRI